MGERNRSAVRSEVRDGRKILVIDFRYTDSEGRQRRYRRDASVQNAAAARAEAERLKRQAVTKGTLEAAPEVPTLEAFVLGDFNDLFMCRLKPSTRVGYEKILDQPEVGLLALLGHKRLNTIGVPEQRLLEAKAIERKAAPRYASCLLRTIMREAYQLGVIDRPAKLGKLPKQSGKLPHAPSGEVVFEIMREARGWHHTAIALAALAGLRLGEVRALKVRNVNLAEMTLTVTHAYSGGELLDRPKGGDDEAIPIAPLLGGMLSDAIKGKGPDEPVVSKKNGQPVSEGALDNALRRIQGRLNRARVKRGFPEETVWSIHKLRHYFGTTVRHIGDPEALRRLMRHKDLTPTMRYLHAAPSDLRRGVALLPEAIPDIAVEVDQKQAVWETDGKRT